MNVQNDDFSTWTVVEEPYVKQPESWRRIADALGVDVSPEKIAARHRREQCERIINLRRQYDDTETTNDRQTNEILIDKMEEVIDLMLKNQRIYNNRVTAPPRPEPTPDPRKPIIRQIGKGGIDLI
jgi:alcohol dehydrogenase class IV